MMGMSASAFYSGLLGKREVSKEADVDTTKIQQQH